MAKKRSTTKAAAVKKSAKKRVKKAGKKPGKPTTKKSARRSPLPRPQVTGDELLFLLFKEDYYARQVFEFLRVETVRELEEYTPRQIGEKLLQPVREAVERIRRHLAEKNRHLADDEEYLRQHLAAARAKAD